MFYYSLPILFNTIRVISISEVLLITVAILALLYIAVPIPETKSQSFPQDSFLLSSWLGQMNLHWVFWPFFILLNLSLFTIDTLAKTANLTVSSWDDIHFILLLTIIWWCISVWRCSTNTNTKLCAALARLATLAVFAEYALKLWIRISYPRIFFDCEDALLNYMSCF